MTSQSAHGVSDKIEDKSRKYGIWRFEMKEDEATEGVPALAATRTTLVRSRFGLEPPWLDLDLSSNQSG